MKISYDSTVDALYIRFIEDPVECEMVHLNNAVTVNIGPGEQVVGIEVLDASQFLEGLKERTIKLENLIPTA